MNSIKLDLTDKNTFLAFTATELMVADGKVSYDSEFRKLSTWSSLNALIYISRINDETSVLISTGDLIASKTFKDIHQLILNRSNGTS